eukprot:403357024
MYKIPETHENFSLSKKEHDDQTIGLRNERHLVCTFCKKILVQQGNAIKVAKYVGLIKNHMREYDNINTYWHIDSIDKIENMEIHGINGEIKYLCCIGCQNEILGFQLLHDLSQIFIACQRVKYEV